MTHARYSTRAKGNEMLNMVQAYAAFDRVPSYHLDDTPPTANDILRIGPHVYLPNDKDENLLRYGLRFTFVFELFVIDAYSVREKVWT